jgi:Ser/Thr protein kinase RdoA (MazF antagonist)
MKSFSRRLHVEIVKVSDILSLYGLDLIGRPKSSSSGLRSQSLIVNTSRGKKLLKRYKESLGQSTIIQEHSILKYLAQLSFPSPRLNLTEQGETIIHYDNHRFALFDYVEAGFHIYDYVLFPSQNSQFLTLAGETLGRLHAVLKNFVPEGYNPDGFRSKTGERWRNDEWIMSKLSFCLEKTQKLDKKKRKNKVRRLLNRARHFNKMMAHSNAMVFNANLPRQIIHKDYGPSNLLFLKNGSPIVLDFEIARLDWRIVDIIGGWKGFCAKRTGYSLTKMKYFLDSYRTQISLGEKELKSIPDVWKLLLIRGSIRSWHNYCETHRPASLAQTYKKIKELDWITANQERLPRI